MAASRTSVGRQLQDVAVEAARLQTKLARDYVAAVGAVSRGQLSPRDYVESLRNEGGRYLSELARLNIDYARGVQRLLTTTSTRLTGVAETVPRATASTGTTRTPVKKASAKKASAKKASAKKTATRRAATRKPAAKQPARARRTPRPPG